MNFEKNKNLKKIVAGTLAGIAAGAVVDAHDVRAGGVSQVDLGKSMGEIHDKRVQKEGEYILGGKRYVEVGIGEKMSEEEEEEGESALNVTNTKQAWEYLLFSDDIPLRVTSALEKLKNSWGEKNRSIRGDNLLALINQLNISKEGIGIVVYTEQLGLNYYELPEGQKKKAIEALNKLLKKRGISSYLEVGNGMRREQEGVESRMLKDCLLYEEQLKTPAIKAIEGAIARGTIEHIALYAGLGSLRNDYLNNNYGVEATAMEMIKMLDAKAKEILEEGGLSIKN